jgi:hypothetical protein
MKAIFFVVFFSGAAFAQTASTSFESADVHGSARGSYRGETNGKLKSNTANL